MCDQASCSTCIKGLFGKASPDRANGKLKKINDDLQQVKMAIEEIRMEIKEEKCSKAQLTNSIKVLSQQVDSASQGIENITHKLQKITEPIATSQEMWSENINTLADLVHELEYGVTEVLPVPAKTKITDPALVDLDDVDGQSSDFVWKIPAFTKKLERLKKLEAQSITSETFFTSKHDFKVKVKLGFDHSQKNINVFLEWDPVSLPYWHARQFSLIDQSNRIDKKHVSIIDTPLFSKNPAAIMRRPFFTDYWLTPLNLLEKDNVYLKDDCILIKVSIRSLALMYKSVASKDGTLLWRIENHASKKRDEMQNIQRFLNSDPFYTDSHGYRVLAHLHLDGHQTGKGKFITIYVGFIIGEFDQALPFPFTCMVKLFLLDQSENTDKQHISSQFAWTCQEGHTYMGQQFVLQSTAEAAPYLKDDSLLLKIMVEIL